MKNKRAFYNVDLSEWYEMKNQVASKDLFDFVSDIVGEDHFIANDETETLLYGIFTEMCLKDKITIRNTSEIEDLVNDFFEKKVSCYEKNETDSYIHGREHWIGEYSTWLDDKIDSFLHDNVYGIDCDILKKVNDLVNSHIICKDGVNRLSSYAVIAALNNILYADDADKLLPM